MRFEFALISSFLLASAVLADRHHHRRSQPPSLQKRVYLNNETAGDMIQGYGEFTSVTGELVVPDCHGDDGSGLLIMVTIDSGPCGGESVSLAVGIAVTVEGNEPSYNVGANLLPGGTQYFSDVPISAGDDVVLSLTVTSTTSGYAEVENRTKGNKARESFLSNYAFCAGNTGWIVTDLAGRKLANFNQVTFTNAKGVTASGEYGPNDNPNLFDIERNGKAVTSTSVDGSSVKIVEVA